MYKLRATSLVLFLSLASELSAQSVPRCVHLVATIVDAPFSVARVPTIVANKLAPLNTSKLYRGLRNPPLIVSPEHLKLFERKTTPVTEEVLLADDVSPRELSKFPTEFVSYTPGADLKSYFKTLESCSDCSPQELRLLRHLVTSVSNNLGMQHFSPSFHLAKSWGTRDAEVMAMQAKYSDADRSWSTNLLREWDETGYVLELPKNQVGDVHVKTSWDPELQALARPEQLALSSAEKMVTSVQIDGRWYDANNPVMRKVWIARSKKFQDAVNILLSSSVRGNTPRQLLTQLEGLSR